MTTPTTDPLLALERELLSRHNANEQYSNQPIGLLDMLCMVQAAIAQTEQNAGPAVASNKLEAKTMLTGGVGEDTAGSAEICTHPFKGLKYMGHGPLPVTNKDCRWNYTCASCGQWLKFDNPISNISAKLTMTVPQTPVSKPKEVMPSDYDALAQRVRELEGWVSDLQSGMYVNCVYCGHRYGPSQTTAPTMSEALKLHIEQCKAHPMSALKAENERLREALTDAIGCVTDWGTYASGYFQNKHGLEGDIKRLQAALAVKP